MSARRVDKRIRTAFDRLFGLPSTSPSVAMPHTGSDDHAGSLVRALIQARFGDAVAADGFLVDGLTAAVQARAEGGRSRARAHTAALRSRAEDLPLRVALGCRRVTAHPAAARSFIGYLLESYGPVALREFVDNYDPERLDHSARRAYHLSLADLEQQWLSWLSRQQTSHNGCRAFLLRLAPLLRPYWFTQLEIFSYMVIGILCGLAVPLASKYLVDTVIPGSDYHVLILFGVGLLTLHIVDSSIGLRRAYVTELV
ncbi:MAG TPA: hypothetical protein VFB50_18560, partial [Chloroflexota bacterium]|nr:hypothetical protein [Chloroflexota bacterium]